MFNDHGQFATRRYFVPSKMRGWWHDNNPLDKVQWSYYMRSPCGSYWETSKGVSGFATEEAAIAAAKKALGI